MNTTTMTMTMTATPIRVSRKRCRPFSFSFSSTFILLVFLVMVSYQTLDIWVEAQTQLVYDCYDDLYLSDENGDGKVDAEEYVDFSRLRLEQQQQQLSDEGYTYDTTTTISISTFVELPSVLQSNFYTLACLCSRFQFDDNNNNDNNAGGCCVGDNAHLSVVTAGIAAGVKETETTNGDDEELMYVNTVCSFTKRAIDDVISTMEIEIIPPSPSPTTSPITSTSSPTTVSPTPNPTTTPTIAPTSRPSATPTKMTIQPTIAPTNRPSATPTKMTIQPTIAPTSRPSATPTKMTIQPTIAPTSRPSIAPTTTKTSTPMPIAPAPVNITIKSSYSILVEDNANDDNNANENDGTQQLQEQQATIELMQQQQQQRDKVNDGYDHFVEDDLIAAMNLVAERLTFEIWSEHERLRVDLPTTIDQIVDVGFTSTPEVINMDNDKDKDNDNNVNVFVGGPCPSDMMMKENENTETNTNTTRQYRCEEVTASIILRVNIDVDDDTLTDIITGTVHDLYAETLERAILSGELASALEQVAPNSMATIATGQVVSTDTDVTTPTTRPFMRVGIIVALVAGGLLLIMILIQFIVLAATHDRRHRRRKHPDDEGQPSKRHASFSADTDDQKDPEAGIIPFSEKLEGDRKNKSADRNKIVDEAAGTTVASMAAGSVDDEDETTLMSSSVVQSKLGQQQRPLDDHGDTSLLVTDSAPYFQADTGPGSITSTDDARSTGGISHESDSGWSEAYASSMGSVSDDDSCLPEPSPGGAAAVRSLSEGPTSTDITTEGEDDHGVLLTTATMDAGETGIMGTNTSKSFIAPESPTTPKSIRLLEEATFENDDDIMIHEDFSDDDDDYDHNTSQHQQSPSAEDFRSKVHALIERSVPEEIDQADDMIAQFTGREDELIRTLLAMEKRASAQKQNDRSPSPSSAGGGTFTRRDVM